MYLVLITLSLTSIAITAFLVDKRLTVLEGIVKNLATIKMKEDYDRRQTQRD